MGTQKTEHKSWLG